MRSSQRSQPQKLGGLAQAFSFFILLFPAVVLGLLASHADSLIVAIGAGVQTAFLLFFLRAHPVWQPPISVMVVVLYLIACVWAWYPLQGSTDWAANLAQGSLLLGAVGLFAIHDLTRTGAEPLRRANRWKRRILTRRGWPADLADCRTVPEAVGLRYAMQMEPAPALSLLSDPRQEVQAAALGALEYQARWREGEAEMVMRHAHKHPEPSIRAAAVYALAGVQPAELVTELAGFLRDPAPEVRLAAAESLMWNADARWPFVREIVKDTLADPKLVKDGPLFTTAGRLPAAAIADLITWSAEHPPLARRAILTVIEHFHGDLLNAERPELANEIATMMLNNDTPPALRVELAGLLREHHMLTPDLLDRLTNMNQPAPMRLFAAEQMLRLNPHDPDGVDVLRGLARQPNRELSLQVAAVLQNVLGLELGLPSGEVQPQSKQAADVARRVLAWANGATAEALNSTPGPRPGLPAGSRPKLPGVGSRPGGPGLVPASAGSRPRPNPLDESMLPPSDGSLSDDLLAPPSGQPPRSVNPLDESMLPPVGGFRGDFLSPPARSPLEESMLLTGEPLNDDLLSPPVPPPRSPLEESMLMPGEPIDDLLSPPAPRSPLDESMLAPEEPSPRPKPRRPPFPRPGGL
ncbi:MAG: HEAT repeat domain-containing protein [Gemmataceae bacterium]